MGSVIKIYFILVISLELKDFVSGEGKCTFFASDAVVCSKITQFPLKLSNSSTIKVLLFQNNNRLGRITNGQLIKLPALQTLLLQNCSITEIQPGAFKGANNLLILNLARNYLKDLDLKVFSDVPNLVELRLNNNPSVIFSAEFPRMNNLSSLSLSNCNLTYIPLSLFKNLISLKTLDLSFNCFTIIDWKIFKPLSNLLVNLSDNPWKCDCHLKSLFQILEQNRIKVDYLNKTKCVWPKTNPRLPYSIGHRWDLVKQEPDWLVCPPHVIKLVSSVTSLKNNNEEVGLICEYFGDPEPSVEFLFNGTRINVQRNLVIKEKFELLLENTTKYDNLDHRFKQTVIIKRKVTEGGGNYTCNVSNIYGKQEKTIFVNNFINVSPDSILAEEEQSILLFGLSLWIFAVICVILTGLILIPVLIVFIYFKKKQRRKELLVRVLTAGIVREIENDRESFTVKSLRMLTLSQGPDFESGYSASDDENEIELHILNKGIPTGSSKTTTL